MEKSPEKKGLAELMIAKHRQTGPPRRGEIDVPQEITRFESHKEGETREYGGA